MNVSVDTLRQLQRHQERIRNISILAHVDHGKTTLSDCLIASNGLIHPKLVGELRYLDSREDEQIRGITMKSSSISLVYHPNPHPQETDMSDHVHSGFLINLIDSPGHIDFCSEVSTAARLTDGCLVIVDAAEGVCIQTHAVLRQAWEEKVHPCLIINKIDRLIVSMGMSPSEVYLRLKQIISDVNLIVSTFASEQYMNEANAVLVHEETKEVLDAATENSGHWGEREDEAFSPIKGNVIFASAIDGWGFRIQQFAEMYAEKLGAKVEALTKALWGDYCFQAKTKTVVKIKQSTGKALKPMFVQFVLEPLYNAYSALEQGVDYKDVLGKIVKGRKLVAVSGRPLLVNDRKQSLKAVMSVWLPIAEAVLSMVIQHLPSPQDAAGIRMKQLIKNREKMETALSEQSFVHYHNVVASLERSGAEEEDPCVIYVSKMIAVEATWLPREVERQRSGDVFLAFGRVFSGVARRGCRMHVLSAAYDPSDPFTKHRQTATLGHLYLMMGRGLELLQDVPAGNVLAIEGLDDVINKSATLSSIPHAPPLVSMTFQSTAIVRVAVEPVLPSEMPKLEQGLQKLSKADPFVEIEILSTGEHVIGAAGEVHLLTCLKDLKERYALIELEVSPPLVAFRESVVENEEDGAIVETSTPTGVCIVRVKAHPLSGHFSNLLNESQEELRQLLTEGMPLTGQESITRLRDFIQDMPISQQQLLKRSWLLGPKRTGPNILVTSHPDGGSLFDAVHVIQLDKKRGTHRPAMPVTTTVKQNVISEENTEDEDDHSISDLSMEGPTKQQDIKFLLPEAALKLGFVERHAGGETAVETPEHLKKVRSAIESGLIAGYQLATAAGPLCDEPMWGVAFEIDIRLKLPLSAASTPIEPDLGEDVYGPFNGQALMEAGPRLVEALYLCEISTAAEFLSGVYSVLSRRRGRILREELREGSDMFIVHAHLPVEASFGLADELRSKSSGAAGCNVMLSHWERLEINPFFIPKTEEEREEFGDEANPDIANLARDLIISVRKRKGLVVQEKVVESATKQRTLSKKV